MVAAHSVVARFSMKLSQYNITALLRSSTQNNNKFDASINTSLASAYNQKGNITARIVDFQNDQQYSAATCWSV